ncbi:unnamed protein product [Owenia fusiformis]|uniref:Uncharacterized protein n=1 Tax=Owenia fusiformis TaxID=6347 RepID=A0A8J1UD07_OWEFU|nr:unnamed protein product [Owenia fusiformis]
MIAIGLEEVGLDEYVKGEFWAGELYIDNNKECYKKLQFTSPGLLSSIGAVFGKQGRTQLSEANKEKVTGNFKGDSYQNGGALVVKAGGDVLLDFKQKTATDQVSLADVLMALGIEGEPPVEQAAPTMVCDDTACKLE